MKKLIDHVHREFEDRYWHNDGLQEEDIDEFVIRVLVVRPVKVASSVKRVAVRVINTMHFCCYIYLNNNYYNNIIYIYTFVFSMCSVSCSYCHHFFMQKEPLCTHTIYHITCILLSHVTIIISSNVPLRTCV